MYKITKRQVKKILKTIKRPQNSHKYNYGNVLIVAGSENMTGAAVLSGRSCIQSGAGLVTYFTNPNIIPILQIMLPEAICIPLTKSLDNTFLGKYNTIIFGPGLGVDNTVKDMLEYILGNYDGKLVIDADGLNTIATFNMMKQVHNSDAQIIFTPHEGEAKRLLNSCNNNKNETILKDTRLETVRTISDLYNVVCILKGSNTLICSSNEVALNTTGNPGMATAGMGDVLAGMIGAFLAQGLSTFDASIVAVWLHGKIGDNVSHKIGELSLISTDIIDNIKTALKKLDYNKISD